MIFKNEIITIRSRKFDGTIHKCWSASLLKKDKNLLVLNGEFEKDINHPKLGIIRRGTISQEFYWLGKWFNVFRFYETDGKLRNFYCNVNMPPKFENKYLDYVDLDIDILVWKNFRIEVLDNEEFELNCKLFKYPAAIISKVNDTQRKILNLIKAREFPFDVNY